MRKTRENSEMLKTKEIKFKKVLAFGVRDGSQCFPMKKQSIPEKIALRPNPEDNTIFTKLRSKLGVDNSQIIRLAIRKLAEAEGLLRAS